MTDELIPAEGISRRDMLKRSAVVGGASAMVWAAPSLTTFSARALGSTGTELTGWSFVAFVVKCGETYYPVKWDRGGGYTAGGNLPFCQGLPFYTFYTGLPEVEGPFTVNPPTQSDNILTISITSDAGAGCFIYGFSENGDGAEGGIGVAKESTDCKPAGEVVAGGTAIRFDVSIFD
jgi:hypothetical protein